MFSLFTSWLNIFLLCLLTFSAHALDTNLIKHDLQQLKVELKNSTLGVPILVRSQEYGNKLTAEVYGELDYPFETIQSTLSTPQNWCEIVLLTFNVKACTYQLKHHTPSLNLYVGRKYYEAPEDAYELQYQFKLEALTGSFLSVVLTAEEGPMGTSNYRIELQAIPAEKGSYLRILSSYETSILSQMATNTYLNTLGRHKVGFSIVGNGINGEPEYIKGVKGVIERNAMRYYLATIAYLEAAELPQTEQFRVSSQRWFDLTENYAKQLHEMGRLEYLQTKNREYTNQLRLQLSINSAVN